MKRPRSRSNTRALKAACTVSAAALMLGVSQAATIGFNFQSHYCGAASYNGAQVTAPAFGIPPEGWENLTQMDTGYGCPAPDEAAGFVYSLNQQIDANSGGGDGLNPLPGLPGGLLDITWSAYTSNVSGFGGYDRNPPHYNFGGNGHRPGEEEVYWGFLRDGVNFGPGSSGGNNDKPGYNIEILGLKSVFGTHPYVVQAIGSADSMKTLADVFLIPDGNTAAQETIAYPNTPPVGDSGDTAWIRGVGGGLSTGSGALTADHLTIKGARAEHSAAPEGHPKSESINRASTIAGFIITDSPVVTMSPQPVFATAGDHVTLRALAIGVPPLTIQWRKGGLPIAGANSLTYEIPAAGLNSGGDYDVFVSNTYGDTTSKIATVTVDKLAIAAQPFAVDSKTLGDKLDAKIIGATWVESSKDTATPNVTRAGVMQFSATDITQIVLPPSPAAFDSTSGTISFWMRSGPVDTTSGAEGAVLFDRRNGDSGLLIVQADDGTLMVQQGPTVNQSSTFASVSDNQWHQVTVAYNQADGGSISIYIDGALDAGGLSLNAPPWSWTAGQPVLLGRSQDSHWRAYGGLLDDFRLYNRALTPVEVAATYASDAVVDPTALVERLNFDTAPAPGVSVSWQSKSAVLQWSDTVDGVFTDIPTATSPYAVRATATAKFFRYSHTPVAIQSNPYDM